MKTKHETMKQEKKNKLIQDLEPLYEQTDAKNLYTLNPLVVELVRKHFLRRSACLEFYACGYARAMCRMYHACKSENLETYLEAQNLLAHAERDLDFCLKSYTLSSLEFYNGENLPF